MQKSTQSKDCWIFKLFRMTCGGKEILRAGALRMTNLANDKAQYNVTAFSPFTSHVSREKCKAAFTLAEVLITLGIISVVAAMTLPALINNKQNKELEAQFKKSYSTLAQAVQYVVLNDYGGSEFSHVAENTTNLEPFIESIQKRYKKSVVCTSGRYDCPTSVFPLSEFSSNASYEFLQNNYKNFNGTNKGGPWCNDGIIAAADGSFIFFDVGTPDAGEYDLYGKLILCVDVNGWRKKPNRVGHDFFIFELNTKTGKFLAPDESDETYFPCSTTSTSSYNGYGCTYRALTEKDYFKNLPK